MLESGGFSAKQHRELAAIGARSVVITALGAFPPVQPAKAIPRQRRCSPWVAWREYFLGVQIDALDYGIGWQLTATVAALRCDSSAAVNSR